MNFDPATLGQALQPGDKMTVAFTKGQPKLPGGSFMDNASKAGMIPGGDGSGAPGGAPIGMPPAPPPMGPPDPQVDPAQRMALMQALQARMGQ